jgi:hypothetical protein
MATAATVVQAAVEEDAVLRVRAQQVRVDQRRQLRPPSVDLQRERC